MREEATHSVDNALTGADLRATFIDGMSRVATSVTIVTSKPTLYFTTNHWLLLIGRDRQKSFNPGLRSSRKTPTPATTETITPTVIQIATVANSN